MPALRLAGWLLCIAAFTGCVELSGRSRVTIVNERFPQRSSKAPLLLDSSLTAEVDETHQVALLGERMQNVVVHADRPLKLVPATEDPISKVAVRSTTTLLIVGLPIKSGPVLIDPALVAKVNKFEEGPFWLTREYDSTQRIVLESRVPLMLVPATQEEADRAWNVQRHGSRPSPATAPNTDVEGEH